MREIPLGDGDAMENPCWKKSECCELELGFGFGALGANRYCQCIASSQSIIITATTSGRDFGVPDTIPCLYLSTSTRIPLAPSHILPP